MKTNGLLIITLILWLMTACDSKNENKVQTPDALETIFSRKSVRKYLSAPVEKEKLDVLLKAGMAAPSGKDMRPWEFLVIDDRAVLD
ncbi:MAG: nitroreductase family protein, partial [Odoribacter sp.]|nr:nitroreductase family protein [Odoribacter sp.]